MANDDCRQDGAHVITHQSEGIVPDASAAMVENGHSSKGSDMKEGRNGDRLCLGASIDASPLDDDQGCTTMAAAVAPAFRAPSAAKGPRTVVFRVDGMTCAVCSSTVERALKKLQGVQFASVSCVTHRANVVFDGDAQDPVKNALEAIDDVGFDGFLLEDRPAAAAACAPLGPSASGAAASAPSRPPPSRLAIAAPQRRLVVLRVGGMTCAVCSSTVERALGNLCGVQEASVSCVTHRATITFEPDAENAVAKAIEAVDDVGFDAELVEERLLEAEATTVGAGSDGASGPVGGGTVALELEVKGLVSPGCARRLEEHLRSMQGVQRANACAALGRAFVVFDPIHLAGGAERLEASVRGLGLGAWALFEGVDTSAATGRASLPVLITPLLAQRRPPAPTRSGGGPMTFEDSAFATPGVVGCQACPEQPGVKKVLYDASVVGARKLLKGFQEDLSDSVRVEFVSVSEENEDLRRHERSLKSLQRELAFAGPPAFIVFFLTVLLPSLGVGMDQMGLLSVSIHHSVDVLAIVIVALATPVQFFVGRRFHIAAYKALKRRSPNMDVLVSVATSTAYFYSIGLILFCFSSGESPGTHDLASATHHFLTMGPILMAVVLLGKYIEGRAKLLAIRALTDLPASMPSTAFLCSDISPGELGGGLGFGGASMDGAGGREIPIELVEIDDVLRVCAGGKIPVDGIMCSEADIYVDESLLTGESAPVLKSLGDELMGGSTCISGGCLLRVAKVGDDTMLGQMVALVQEAQASKANVQRIADKVARVFVPSVIGLAFLTFVVWAALVLSGVVNPPSVPMGHGGRDMHMKSGEHMKMQHSENMDDMGPGMMEDTQLVSFSLKILFAMKFGMSVLMIACPCAMGLATPMAVMVATGVAAKRGCLVKSAAALETSSKLNVIVLDKTGTITVGSPSIQSVAIVVEAFDGSLFDHWLSFRRSVATGNQGSSSHGPSAEFDSGKGDELGNGYGRFEDDDDEDSAAGTGEASGAARDTNGGFHGALGGSGGRVPSLVSRSVKLSLAGLPRGGLDPVSFAAAPPPTSLMARGRMDLDMLTQVQDCFWWLLGTLESASDHPVARGVTGVVRDMAQLPPIAPPTDFEYISGRGLRCVVDQLGGVEARIGSMQFAKEALPKGAEAAPADAELLQWVCGMQDAGNTVIVLHTGSRCLGAAALRDPIRPDAAWVVKHLSERLGLEVVMCTGDNRATAHTIAKEVGIQKVIAEALPSTKRECVRDLQTDASGRQRKVCFVGDGVNDSLALAQADVGIAIGVGAQVAVEAADVALVRAELRDSVNFLSLSKRTFRTILMNFFWAFCFNFVCLPLAAGVLYPTVHIPPLAAGIGMASSSCLVVLTSLSIRNHRALSATSSGAPSRTPRKRAWLRRRRRKGREPENVPLTAAAAAASEAAMDEVHRSSSGRLKGPASPSGLPRPSLFGRHHRLPDSSPERGDASCRGDEELG